MLLLQEEELNHNPIVVTKWSQQKTSQGGPQQYQVFLPRKKVRVPFSSNLSPIIQEVSLSSDINSNGIINKRVQKFNKTPLGSLSNHKVPLNYSNQHSSMLNKLTMVPIHSLRVFQEDHNKVVSYRNWLKIVIIIEIKVKSYYNLSNLQNSSTQQKVILISTISKEEISTLKCSRVIIASPGKVIKIIIRGSLQR